MRFNYLKISLKKAVLVTTVLLLGAGLMLAQQQINLSAGYATLTAPDGTSVPMWGYSCGAVVANSTATCAKLNPFAPNAAGAVPAGWSPVIITVPVAAGATGNLTINLTNNLTFGATKIPTSLVIVGQVGGGLGTVGAGCTAGTTCTTSPDHSTAQEITWPIADPSTSNAPPAQGKRVQSFGTEVAAGTGTATALNWPSLRPGTYLLESGTHPSIQGPMGLYGIVVVTTKPGVGTPGTAYGADGTAVLYNAEVPLLMSEIDPVQNAAVNTAVNTPGFSETMVWNGEAPNPANPAVPAGGGCGYPGSPTYHQCYPPAVNYTPLYYLFNGVAFNKTAPLPSVFPASPSLGVAGTVLVRLVNAGLRMHVPSIVGSTTDSGLSGFSLIAEDGNVLPDVQNALVNHKSLAARVQSEVFMAAGKTYDVLINVPTLGSTALPIYDRELSLSSNAVGRDGGMLAYISVNAAAPPAVPGLGAAAVARADTYNSVIGGQTLTVSDPSKGLIANDTNVYGVQVLVGPTKGTLTLNANGTFQYVANAGTVSDSFTYCANGTVTAGVCSSGISTTVTLGAAPIEGAGGITCTIPAPPTYTSTISTTLSIHPPGVLSFCKDAAGYPLTVASATPAAGLTLTTDPNGGFNATVGSSGTYTFTFVPQNSQGTKGAAAMVTLNFPAANGPTVTVLDGKDKTTVISDYRWVIEEDRTFYVDPACTTNPLPAGCPVYGAAGIVPTFGTNFHTSFMPLVAAGCTGPLSCEVGQTLLGAPAVCDIGNGGCRTTGAQEAQHMPSEVVLDPTKRYYLTIFPGDASNSFVNGGGVAVTDAQNPNGRVFDPSQDCTAPGDPANPCGHGMGGAPIAKGQNAVTVYVQPNPFPPSKLSVFVFEDDFPLNGEQDGGGGTGLVVSPDEPGLGGFNIILFDDAGGTGDATGQMTYDMFNQPLGNSLAGTVDPATGNDACPISVNQFNGVNTATGNYDTSAGKTPTSPLGITGTIVTCPKYESDGTTLSPLAGQAVIANLMPGRYGVVATPGADRIARGEEWLQTNTLDGQKAHDSFLRIGEPAFFQEFGPAGYHVSIGFANPKIIQNRLANVCNGTDPNITGTNCTNTVSGLVTTERMSRTPDERLYSSGDNSSFSFTQCYVSFGDADGEDFAFTKCNPDGTFSISGLPDGDWRVTVFDQWNDMLVDGLSTPVRLSHTNANSGNLGDIAMNQWQANLYTSTFFDNNYNGIQDGDEDGLALVATNIRFRDGSYSNFNNTDLHGQAGFNEVFPLFSWYVVETDTTRYKSTGVHVVYDAGGPADGSPACTGGACGTSTIGNMMANTKEQVSLPMDLRVPGARYCNTADCLPGDNGTATGSGNAYTPGAVTISTGRVDPPFWFGSEGWQGFSGQNSFIEFGKKPYAPATATTPAETGGIHGEVIYASTRPFDDPTLLIHTSWTPDVPGVTINLYQEGTAPDGTQSLKLIDTTVTSSWDAWAQGFRSDGKPNMNCPGQGKDIGAAADLFFFSLFDQPMYLDFYNNQHGGPAVTTIPYNSEFKCYDGMHNWNQVQPAPYDGMYQFPSVTSLNPTTGKPAGTNCHMSTPAEPWGCIPNPTIASGPTTAPNYDPYRAGLPMLPAGKYVVEMIVPPGYELVKEEDKNILIGDNYIAPVTMEFGGLGNVFILPDQAAVGSTYNSYNDQNPTTDLSATPRHEGDTGSVETFWPCVGLSRVVPDYLSIFPAAQEVSPFAGAKRNLCDRKEVTLDDQTSALAKFWVFTSAHVAAHYTGVITDDFTSEFDPFSPQFGEKFSPPNMPISLKDWTGTEISRTYADEWGTYDGLTYSTWEVNPPNPTGYAPTMMVVCMNDPGTGNAPDALFNPQYSQFCYEIPFMPGQTQYMDTPVVPTSAFAGAGYNNPDCAYPANTPAIKEVDSQEDGIGPYVSAAGHHLVITSLGQVLVPNNAYSGPGANTAPYNQKTVLRNFGFGGSTGMVTIGNLTATVNSWSDSSITVTVPGNVPLCAVQQQAQYGGSQARCGELVITTAAGQQSIDAVTVTVGGKAPTHVPATGSIQAAIDAAKPGDLLIIDPTCTLAGAPTACTTAGAVKTAAAHEEMLLMWKPVRLQGVGAESSIINANTHPAGKMDTWRAQVNCLFGLGLDGSPNTWSPACAGANWFGFNTKTPPQVDRLPFEAVVGWDATLNGNLAELLQEPSLMGALEGAGITVLSKGVNFHGQAPYSGVDGAFPTGTTLLIGVSFGGNGNFSSGDSNANCHSGPQGSNLYPSNFQCNPSSIDGLTITDSSQGGGGVFVHAWGHNLQIANNRIHSNQGTLSGGINLGQGEFPPSYLGGSIANSDPGSCQVEGFNIQEPYCFNMHVNIHHNAIMQNSSTGDELFSATPAGAGGVSFCNGADYYTFQYNWVCGNLSTGDGGGIAHIGFSYNGDIEHNSVIFNQATNPTIPTNGGGVLAMGAPDVDPPCTSLDQDCLSAPSLISPSDGTGPNLVINANLIMGNAADSGTGGGLRLQNINGAEVVNFPTGNTSARWNHVLVENNIIVNNVAGWDGGGVSLLDALNTDIINNTIMSNDSTASAGPLFDTIGAPLASAGGSNCIQAGGTTASCPQVAGLVSVQNSAVLSANLANTITCPTNHGTGGTSNSGRNNGACRYYSYPELWNNAFWQNRTFYIGVGSLGGGNQNQQNVVALYNSFDGAAVASQTGTGSCNDGNNRYWDIGVRGDTGPSNHTGSTIAGLGAAGRQLTPVDSVITDIADYPGNGNSGASPLPINQYCNGSRVPPELLIAEGAQAIWQVPPGISDATVPNPLFNLTPNATVDEGNNWINMSWGPLAEANPLTGTILGNYGPSSGSSSVVNRVPGGTPQYTAAPQLDFYGNNRKANNAVDAGAVEFAAANNLPTLTSINPNNGFRGDVYQVTLTGTNLAGGTINITGGGFGGVGITVSNVVTSAGSITATFTISPTTATGNRNVSVTTAAGTTGTLTFTISNPPAVTLTSINPNNGARGSAVNVTLVGTNFTTNGTTIAPGAGITVSNLVVVDSQTINATFTIAAGAGLGNRNVTVNTPATGISNPVVFTVHN